MEMVGAQSGFTSEAYPARAAQTVGMRTLASGEGSCPKWHLTNLSNSATLPLDTYPLRCDPIFSLCGLAERLARFYGSDRNRYRVLPARSLSARRVIQRDSRILEDDIHW